MRNLVLSVIGDDRPGLVSALSDAVASGGGNWEQSQLAQLAGKFAGIVAVAVPREKADSLIAAVTALDGLLDVSVHEADAGTVGGDVVAQTIAVLGDDRPGIVQEISAALNRTGVSIAKLTTGTREAPMSGGTLFEARMDVLIPADADTSAIRADLEAIAAELLVDLDVDSA
ncbi:MAG: ACT domain-containing protein [Gordonia sp. (in: high G+C Gram-positive bacteria)]|uniref:glycine cleavage system protein R n=1 Tax=Gordonia sp. (in: high G+C Gram-positive bacteria) TaxID=84139 RepID=UPI003BB4F1E7